MEQHPIPRNITGFQFKLIGDMTLRQFGYLASGGLLGYILFKILPFPFVLNLTIGGTLFFIGFALAFLPFQDRPLDQWIMAFIKSVYSSTQYVYFKDNLPPDIIMQYYSTQKKTTSQHYQKQYSDSKRMLENYLSKLPKKTSESLDQNEKMYLNKTLSLFSQTAVQPQSYSDLNTDTIKIIKENVKNTMPKQTIPAETSRFFSKNNPAPTLVHTVPVTKKEIPVLKPTTNNQNQIRELATELKKLKEDISNQPEKRQTDVAFEKKFLDLEQKLIGLLTERERLTQEIASLKQKNYSGNTVEPKKDIQPQTSSNVKIMTQQQATSTGIIDSPTTPNIVTGIIKDSTGATLSNILITIKDLRGTPLRALKTNQLGHFFTSTPLTNGTYVIEIEDPQKRFAFDLVEIKIKGEIVEPLEIIAKREIDPIREKLTKELFQKNFN